ncbi:peroxiredoxin [Seleniivibrio sp.]|uniref:peroxiredoxin n=1 Tax=Seleniivibrio sp. TaxID=2898801 RepID=UPI0025DA6A02|nr:peroxiredoxin [Seleniivibrio sp.]MCD8553817.1 peroxiredoxin [Seleniivibrio sp.]
MAEKLLEEGMTAPDFSLEGDDGNTYSLASFKGKKLVLYFYPKDNTSGCTKEAIAFTQVKDEFGGKNAVIVGVSPDSIKSHQNFKTKHSLNFLLLSDPDRSVAAAYGAYGEKKMYGKAVMGIIRSTFVIGENGKLEKAFRNVKVDGHAEKVMCVL